MYIPSLSPFEIRVKTPSNWSPRCLNLPINISYPPSGYILLSFFFFSIRYWLDLTPSQMIWNTADTGWILTSIASFFDPWVFGSCIFIHNLPQTDSEVILNVREKLMETDSSAESMPKPIFDSIHRFHGGYV